jgi:V/A-type H+-transporting ATPase subunit I
MNVFTVPMKLLTAVVLDEATDQVKRALLKLGVLDFIQVSRLAPEQASRLVASQQGQDPQVYASLRARIETLLMQASVTTPSTEQLNPDTMEELDTSRAKALVDRITADLSTIREQQKQISQTRIRVEELYRYVVEQKLQYIDIRIGKPEKGSMDLISSRLANQASVVLQIEKWSDLVLLTLKRDRQQINALIDALGWIENPDGSLQKHALVALEQHLKEQLQSLDAENTRVKGQIAQRILEDRDKLEQLWCTLRLHELLGEITRNFSHTRNTTLFSGWVPASEAEDLESAIRSASAQACVIEWTDAKQVPREEIPVAVEDIPLLRPFQRLVDNYSVPEYGTINPTPFVAVSYLCMFGLMFADAGQGLVILLLGLLGLHYYRKHPQSKDRMISKNLTQLFVYLGGASIVSGILFGSYFGYPLIAPLWFDYHAAVIGHGGDRDVYSILGITIWFGIVVIGCGLILNWINLIRKNDWFHLLMDKNGVLGGWLFGCGIWAAFAFVQSDYRELPSGLFLPLAFGIPLLLLFAKVPLHRYLARREGQTIEPKSVPSLVMEMVLEWIVDLLEIFSGFLANTLSFMRVAGLGIAHVSLMSAFAQMADQAGGGVAALVILVLGNVMVIALEGLSAGIQALRLNYYEFFTKYFTGRGLSYNPISLRQRTGNQIISHS